MADVVRGVDRLQTELEKAKESLKDVDENIKKLTGRDPTIQRTPISQRRVSLGTSDSRGIERSESRGAGANRLFSLARRGIIQDGGPPRAREGGAFARLGPRPDGRGGARDRGATRRGRDSGDEDELPNKPTLQSSVIATPKEEPTRNAMLQEQSRDRRGQARNRRMFGLLLGTLQKFKEDAAETKDKEEQRIKIEKKLDEKFKQEKEDIKRERRQLFIARKQKQFRIRLIEQKMEMVANHEEWEKETRKLNNFLRTQAKPHIFFMPKIPGDDLELKLKETEKAVDEMIIQRRKKLEEEIDEMMSQVHDGQDDHDDDDDNMEDDGEKMDNDNDHDNEREVHRMKREGEGDNKENDDDFLSERERRNKEREERDRELQMRDKAREERIRKRERKESEKGDKEDNKGRSRSRDRSVEKKGERGDKSGERDRGRDKGRERKRDRSDGKDRSRDRDRHRSGKSRSERHESRKDGEGERSHKHSSKSKRRSKGEGKTERKEKVWEPMEDEEEEEFVAGSKDNEKSDKSDKSLAAKMMELAGMSMVDTELESSSMNVKEGMEERSEISQNQIALEDIPRPPEVESTMEQTSTEEPLT